MIYGGRSSEHAVSCMSAANVLANLDPDRYTAVPIAITKRGQWTTGTTTLEDLRPGADGSLPEVEAGERVTTLPPVDVVLPLLHGVNGEDGTVQGMLELANVPYVGCGVFASAAAMDKEYSKKLLAAEGFAVVPYAVLGPTVDTLTPGDQDRLGLPVFVKPARGGSSIGITRVEDWDNLPEAIIYARTIDPKVIVETAATGREIEVGVLEYPDGILATSLPAEIRAPSDGGWYDFDSKYFRHDELRQVPAHLDLDTVRLVREFAAGAFVALGCRGLARVDFFVSEHGDPVVNEINAMPGLSAASMYPQMWAATGLEFPKLLDILIHRELGQPY